MINLLSDRRRAPARPFQAALALLLAGGLSACDSVAPSAADGPTSEVSVQFAAVGSTTGPTAAARMAAPMEDEIVVAGSNGTLTITDVRLLVAEFELNGAECGGSDDDEDGPECGGFEAPPSFVDLPLGTGAVAVASTDIPEGLYESLEFEVENLDLGEDDDPTLAGLADAVRAAFPEWPDEASAVVVGTFTPTGGSPRPFTVFLEAEIEVELEFAPPLDVQADGAGDALTVKVDPALWFARADGTVLDLSVYDYGTTGEALEFELDLERGLDVEDEDDDEEEEDEDDD